MADDNGKRHTFRASGGRIVSLPQRNIEFLLGDIIFRVTANTRLERVNSGHYRDPFKVLHCEQNIVHGFKGPHDAFRATVHAKIWEGAAIPPSYVPFEGERQKILAMLGRHRSMQLMASDRMLNGPEREAFEKLARELARRLKIPRNEAKRRILELMLMIATGEDKHDDILMEAIGLDHKRLQQVGRIEQAVNWRSAVMLHEIHWQHELMAECDLRAAELKQARPNLLTCPDRIAHLEMVRMLIMAWDRIKDRPYYGQAARNIRDAREYYTLARDHFPDAGEPLNRIVASAPFKNHVRKLNIVLFLLATAMGYRGSKREEIEMRAQTKLATVSDAIGDPSQADCLHNNPLWSALGLVNDALKRLCYNPTDWEDVRTLVRLAAGAFSGH